MAKAPDYVILGRGRWAQRMRQIISGEGRSVALIEETRQRPSENESDYLERLAKAIKASRPQIAPPCVSPVSHVSLMVQRPIHGRVPGILEEPEPTSRNRMPNRQT